MFSSKFVQLCSKRSLSTSKHIVISDKVRNALQNGEPIVALESTIITHGMPQPHNIQCAKRVEEIVEQNGAIPATIAMIKGQIHVGLTNDMLENLAKDQNAVKISRRDFPVAIAKQLSGGTTVAGTMLVAKKVGIPIFVTGGIGGVHRNGQSTMDISADLTELGRTPVAVICAGVKSVLDIGRTLEYLETQGVCVASMNSESFPSFFSSKSSFTSPNNITSIQEAARIIYANLSFNQNNGVLLAVPVPEKHSIDHKSIEAVIDQALGECDSIGVKGKEVTPHVLDRVNQLTSGKSLQANKALIENNACVGANIAVELSKLTNVGNGTGGSISSLISTDHSNTTTSVTDASDLQQ